MAGDFFPSLERLQAAHPALSDRHHLEPRVVSGGDQRQRRRNIEILPWSDLNDVPWW